MAITLIATGSAASSDKTTISCIVTLNTTGATLLVLAVEGYNNRYAGQSPVDGNGHTWTGLTARGTAGELSTVQLWYVNSATPSVGAGHTFTAGNAGGDIYATMHVWAFDGTIASPLRTESGNVVSGSPTSIQPSAAVGASGDVVITAVSNNLGAGTAQAINSGFTKSTNYGFDGTTHAAGSGAYKIVAGSEQPTWSGLDGSDAAVVIAAFQAAGGGASFVAAQERAILQAVNRAARF